MAKLNMKRVKKMSIWVPKVDGGWGWIVVLGSFFVHVFADGIVYSFGVLLPIFMKEFNSTNAETSVILGLLVGITLAVGPIASACANKWGCRVTTIAGSIIATTGSIASLYATSVPYLMASAGCVMGIGAGFMYCPAIVIVTVYFEKRRSMATGLAVCGAGVGTLLIAPLADIAIKFWGWHGAFYLYTVILVLCSLCGATFRPLPFVEVTEETGVKDETQKENNKVDLFNNVITNENISPKDYELRALLDRQLRPYLSHSALNGVLKEQEENDVKKTKSLLDIYSRPTVLESTGFLNIKDVFYTGSVTALQKGDEKFRSLTLLQPEPNDILENCNDHFDPEDRRNRMREVFRSLNKILNFTLLWDPVFLVFAVSNFLTSIGFNAPLIFIPSHAKQLHLPSEKGAYLLSAFGIFNTVGRILFGIISDRKLPSRYGKDVKRNRLWIYIISLCICGLVTCFVFACNTYLSLLVYAALFGLTISSYVCLTSVLLVDLLGLDKLTSAFGILLLFQGIATFIGPPVSGKLADIMKGNYGLTFVFCGVCLLISGIMLIAIIPIRRWQVKRESYNKSGVM